MTNAELTEMTKANLQMITSAMDTYISQLVEVAKKSIVEEGITLDVDDIQDCNLVVMFTAYLYQKRQSAEPMPRMLRYALNNRLMREKMKAGGC